MATSAHPFWTYWAASTTSGVGTAVTTVALPLAAVTVLDVGPIETGLLAASSYLAWALLGLPAGAIVHRLPLRATQVAADLVRAAAMLAVPLIWWLGELKLVHLVVAALVVNVAEVFFFTANTTFLPSVVPKHELTNRNSLVSGTQAATQLGGPSVAGLLVQAVGAVPALLVDAVSYVVSAVLLRRLPERREPALGDADARPGMGQMIAEGWRFVVRHPVMAPGMWWACVVNLVCGVQAGLFALYLVRDLDAPPAMVGVLLAADGVGSLLAAAATPWLVRRFGSARILLFGGLVGFVGALLIPAGEGATGWMCFAVGTMVFAASVVPGSVVTRTYRQVASPPELLSRVMATVRFASWSMIPLGSLAAGILAAHVGSRAVLLASAFVLLIGPVVIRFSVVRRLRDLEDFDSSVEIAAG
ncbi:MFS family permease [Microbacterium natoriense]|uniref:MFS family permease n=1 Tax=Microbacterium natoriense TaxID=284570 RepID=A0AAW8EW20_9MICO|nr:MFS transporter [Microbacterium natoriense]MDQ0647452.1 MFS family permease [Microbacterium natoriense]